MDHLSCARELDLEVVIFKTVHDEKMMVIMKIQVAEQSRRRGRKQVSFAGVKRQQNNGNRQVSPELIYSVIGSNKLQVRLISGRGRPRAR